MSDELFDEAAEFGAYRSLATRIRERSATTTGREQRAATAILALLAEVERVSAERDELNQQVMTVQTTSAYDLGHEHGSAVAAKYKAERDAQQRLIARLELIHGAHAPGCAFQDQLEAIEAERDVWMRRATVAETDAADLDAALDELASAWPAYPTRALNARAAHRKALAVRRD